MIYRQQSARKGFLAAIKQTLESTLRAEETTDNVVAMLASSSHAAWAREQLQTELHERHEQMRKSAGRPGSKRSEESRDQLGRHVSNLASVLARVDPPEDLRSLLGYERDPRVRIGLSRRLATSGMEPEQIWSRLRVLLDDPEMSTAGARQALILTLGRFGDDLLDEAERLLPDHAEIPRRLRREIADTLLDVYTNDPDPGVHLAIDWLLRRWGYESEIGRADEELRRSQGERQVTDQLKAGRLAKRWYVTGNLQTMVIVSPPPGIFPRGTDAKFLKAVKGQDLLGPEPPGDRRIDYVFAISAKEVTRGEFKKYLKHCEDRYLALKDVDDPATVDNVDLDYLARAAELSQRWQPEAQQESPRLPAAEITWRDAMGYCAWLTEQDPVVKHLSARLPDAADRRAWLVRGFDPSVEQTGGYRLPTEDEWECACRAGTITFRNYGFDDGILGEHTWYRGNSPKSDRSMEVAHEVGRLLPNAWGLFDMYGNVEEWCLDATEAAGPATPLAWIGGGEQSPRMDQRYRVTRGGNFESSSVTMRSSRRNTRLSHRLGCSQLGFRIVRTLAPAPQAAPGTTSARTGESP
jgi:formylglycine-generating enzyme required for sulfatase activity